MQLARELQPDVILCDVYMEGADGRLTLYALRRDPQVASIPFVLMSANALSGEALPGSGRGADGFLHKPFSQEKLLTTIEACLSNKVEQSAGAAERMKVIHDEARAAATEEGLLQLLEQIIEATGRIRATDPKAAPADIKRWATVAHESALRLKELIGGQWREANSKLTGNSPKTPE